VFESFPPKFQLCLNVVYAQPTEEEIKKKQEDRWELCDAPEGVIGRDLDKEPTYPHSKFFFKRKVASQ
jgi:hypothetical protein